MGQNHIMYHLLRYPENNRTLLLSYSTQICVNRLKYQETTDIIKFLNILLNNWLVLLENAKVMEDKERLRGYHRLVPQGTKVIGKLNSMHNSRLDCGSGKDKKGVIGIIGITGDI